jgi:hypothetical protein
MSEFKVNRDRQKVYIEESRPADGCYHAGEFQKYAEAFAELGSNCHQTPSH